MFLKENLCFCRKSKILKLFLKEICDSFFLLVVQKGF